MPGRWVNDPLEHSSWRVHGTVDDAVRPAVRVLASVQDEASAKHKCLGFMRGDPGQL